MRRVHLSDLHPISQQEFETACHICDKIRYITESRASYINEHNIDPTIALPDGNWISDTPNNTINKLYQLVVSSKYEVINNLRLYTQPFSGYDLASLSLVGEPTIPYPIPDNFDKEGDKIPPISDVWVDRYIASIYCIPEDIIAKPPKILGEIGWDVDGSPINYDTYAYQERLNLLYESGIIDWLKKNVKSNGSVNILEIGGGYGGLAYYLKHIVPQSNYYICDIPESLLFSSLYLAIVCPEYQHTIYDGNNKPVFWEGNSGFNFLPNYMFDDLVKEAVRIDLTINTLSFHEMTEKQMRFYAQNLRLLLGDTGILFEQNPDLRNRTLTCTPKLYLPTYFRFRRATKPQSIPELSKGVPDIWANKDITDILGQGIKLNKRLLIKRWGQKEWLLWKLSSSIHPLVRHLVENKHFAMLHNFVKVRPRLKSAIMKIVS